MAQKGYAAYEQSQNAQNNSGQQNNNVQQTQQHNSQSDTQGQGTLPGQSVTESHIALSNTNTVDHGQAAQIANNQSGSSGNSELFSQAMAFLSGVS